MVLESRKDVDGAVGPKEKKPYSKPQLQIYGDLRVHHQNDAQKHYAGYWRRDAYFGQHLKRSKAIRMYDLVNYGEMVAEIDDERGAGGELYYGYLTSRN